jgi:allantoinase
MSDAPARLAGLEGGKGAIATGGDADFVLWDPEATFAVAGAQLEHRHALTPYEGRRLRGMVVATYLRGEVIWREGVLATSFAGRLL